MAQHGATTLIEILEGKRSQFVVPIYQRGYHWKSKQVDKLLNDLIDFRKENIVNPEQKYYVGNIITKKMNQQNGEILSRTAIVDGQQRITTTILIMLALLKYDHATFESLEDNILLKTRDLQKLKLDRVDDSNIIEKIFKDRDLSAEEKNTNMYKNFKHVLKFISQKTNENANVATEILVALENTLLIEIQLGQHENENQVFETINSSGIKLSNGDLIKNFLFFGVHNFTQEQESELIHQYNNNIEAFISEDEIDSFYRYYNITLTDDKKLASKRGTNIYECFRSKMQELKFDFNDYDSVINQMNNIEFVAKIWHFVEEGKFQNNHDNFFLNVVRQNKNTYMPLIIDLVKAFAEDLFEENLAPVFRILAESIILRATVGLPDKNITREVGGIFRSYKKEVENVSPSSFREWLSLSQKNFRTPSIVELNQKTHLTQIYDLSPKKTNAVLKTYELSLRSAKISEFNANEELTVEHIMPQNINSSWYEGLDDNEKNLKYSKVHVLGNLTLLTKALNSTIKDDEFSVKVNGKPANGDKPRIEGIKDCTFKMSQEISNMTEFTEETIKIRTTTIIDKISKFFNSFYQ